MPGHAVDDFLADGVGAEDEEVGAEGAELAEKLVVLDAVDAEEAAAGEGGVLAAQAYRRSLRRSWPMSRRWYWSFQWMEARRL